MEKPGQNQTIWSGHRRENGGANQSSTTPAATDPTEATGGTTSANASASASTSANPGTTSGEPEVPPEDGRYVTVEECLRYIPEPEKTRAEMRLRENLFDRHLFVQFLQMRLSEHYPQCSQFSYDHPFMWDGRDRKESRIFTEMVVNGKFDDDFENFAEHYKMQKDLDDHRHELELEYE